MAAKFLMFLALLAAVLWLVVWVLNARSQGLTGTIEGRLQPCPASPNCVSSQAEAGTQHIEPLPFQSSPREASERLKEVMRGLSRTRLVAETPEYLHYTATSAFFRFVDDVEFLIDRQSGLIHLRSASRIGHSDLGVNRRRLEEIGRRFAQLP